MKSRLVAGIAAAVLAIVGIITVFAYANGADNRAMTNLEPVDVLVITEEVAAGTPAESLTESTTTKTLPRSAVPENALKNLDGLTGKVTGTKLLVGEQLLAERFVDPAELQAPGSAPVPTGLQEVTFSVEPQRLAGGKITAGDTVGLFASFEAGVLKDEPELETTQRVFHKVLVTGIQRGDAPAQQSPDETAAPNPEAVPGSALLVTVAVADTNAAKIIFAAEFGTIWLTKEPAEATEDPPTVIRKSDVYP